MVDELKSTYILDRLSESEVAPDGLNCWGKLSNRTGDYGVINLEGEPHIRTLHDSWWKDQRSSSILGKIFIVTVVFKSPKNAILLSWKEINLEQF